MKRLLVRDPRIYLLLALMVSVIISCRAQSSLLPSPSQVPTPQIVPDSGGTAGEIPTPSAAPTQLEITDTPRPSPAVQEQFSCKFSQATDTMLSKTSAGQWIDWIEKLSGAEPVIIGGKETRITTRFTPSMFNGAKNARAFEFVHETISGWYPPEQVMVLDYSITDQEGKRHLWKNLAVTLPGETRPDEIVLLTAHLDSISKENPEEIAPGAEDNGSGSAALLEAARILKDYRFERTIQIVWFTGEELGLFGSREFIKQIRDRDKILGVINLDMFGYDSDNDRCFELHVGTLPESDLVGQCFVDSITEYRLDLPRYDYLTDDAVGGSDHSRFWNAGIGAIEVLEDMIPQQQQGGCPSSDPNPGYHTPLDTVDQLNPETGIQIVRAALATIAGMADILE